MTIPPPRQAPKMQRCPKTPVNGVPRHHMVELRGLEPLTFSLRKLLLPETQLSASDHVDA
jgi:hypothetical protein